MERIHVQILIRTVSIRQLRKTRPPHRGENKRMIQIQSTKIKRFFVALSSQMWQTRIPCNHWTVPTMIARYRVHTSQRFLSQGNYVRIGAKAHSMTCEQIGVCGRKVIKNLDIERLKVGLSERQQRRCCWSIAWGRKFV